MRTNGFRVGITPDFYTDAKGRFEAIVDKELAAFEVAPMPPQPGNVATAEALDHFDALFALGLKLTADSLQGVQRLAVVARWGVGYDMIDVDALTAADIVLAITPNAVRRPVAEAIFALLFGLTTNLVVQDRTVRRGGWRADLRAPGRNVLGRTLGSVGCGNIAREMFRMAKPLGFGRLLAFDPYAGPADGVEMVSLERVMAESDFVAINAPLNAETRGLIGEPELRAMKPTAYLINTSRGALVQETVLVRALQEGWIAGAGLDVFEREPLPSDSPLRSLENVILAPHALAWTEEIVRDNGMEACANIRAIARGEVPSAVVNREVLGRPGFQRKLAAYRGERA